MIPDLAHLNNFGTSLIASRCRSMEDGLDDVFLCVILLECSLWY